MLQRCVVENKYCQEVLQLCCCVLRHRPDCAPPVRSLLGASDGQYAPSSLLCMYLSELVSTSDELVQSVERMMQQELLQSALCRLLALLASGFSGSCAR